MREGYAEKKTLNEKNEVLWTYEGVYSKDIPNGQGQLELEHIDQEGIEVVRSRKLFSGNFAEGVLEGFGRCTIENQVSYSGQWEKGKPHGHG